MLQHFFFPLGQDYLNIPVGKVLPEITVTYKIDELTTEVEILAVRMKPELMGKIKDAELLMIDLKIAALANMEDMLYRCQHSDTKYLSGVKKLDVPIYEKAI